MTDTETWPYDALQHDPLTSLRIAPVGSAWPRWAYIAAFDTSSPQRPTDTEALMLQSWLLEYIDHWYTAHWKRRLAERPYDIDGGANGVVFHKWAENDWGFRRRTWTRGPEFWPGWSPREDRVSYSLAEILDRTHSNGSEDVPKRWLDWKAAHPEVFGV